MSLLSLDWLVDSEGYRISESGEPAEIYCILEPIRRVPLEGDRSYLAEHRKLHLHRPFIVRNGGDLARTKPLDDGPGLCRHLAQCDSLEKKLNFVNRYGFLHGDTYQAESTRLMTLSVQRAAEMVAMVDARKWSELESYLRGLGSGMYSIGIAPPERSGRPALKFFPFNLFLAATAQLLEEAASGGQFKSCIRPGCGRYFGYGPGTGRRETALYCSPRCQKAHDYQKRKEAQR